MEEITSPWTYLWVFVALVALTLATVGFSFLHVGEAWHTLVGLVIATAKALLVALFFMHVLHSSRLTWILLGSGLFWLGILLVLTMSDYLSRAYLAY